MWGTHTHTYKQSSTAMKEEKRLAYICMGLKLSCERFSRHDFLPLCRLSSFPHFHSNHLALSCSLFRFTFEKARATVSSLPLNKMPQIHVNHSSKLLHFFCYFAAEANKILLLQRMCCYTKKQIVEMEWNCWFGRAQMTHLLFTHNGEIFK